jgi:hypothetical protein
MLCKDNPDLFSDNHEAASKMLVSFAQIAGQIIRTVIVSRHMW